MTDEIRQRIENLIGEYCDGTYNGLERAHFISNFGEKSKRKPQELADRLVELFEEWLHDFTA